MRAGVTPRTTCRGLPLFLNRDHRDHRDQGLHLAVLIAIFEFKLTTRQQLAVIPVRPFVSGLPGSRGTGRHPLASDSGPGGTWRAPTVRAALARCPGGTRSRWTSMADVLPCPGWLPAGHSRPEEARTVGSNWATCASARAVTSASSCSSGRATAVLGPTALMQERRPHLRRARRAFASRRRPAGRQSSHSVLTAGQRRRARQRALPADRAGIRSTPAGRLGRGCGSAPRRPTSAVALQLAARIRADGADRLPDRPGRRRAGPASAARGSPVPSRRPRSYPPARSRRAPSEAAGRRSSWPAS